MEKNDFVSALAVIRETLDRSPDESLVKGCAVLLGLLIDDM